MNSKGAPAVAAVAATAHGGDPATVPPILVCLNDLMLILRIESVAAALGFATRSAGSLAEARGALSGSAPAAILLDLTSPEFPLAETLELFRGAQGKPFVLAFFPHVMKNIGEAARAAGSDLVVPRSRLMAELPALLRRAVEANANASAEESGAAQIEPA